MRIYDKHGIWRQIEGKRRPHWAILTLDDLPKSNSEYIKLIAELQEKYKAARMTRILKHKNQHIL